jgi:hypothetical protein
LLLGLEYETGRGEHFMSISSQRMERLYTITWFPESLLQKQDKSREDEFDILLAEASRDIYSPFSSEFMSG